jgi:hypothetical protein
MVERVAKAMADADDEDVMECWREYSRRARAAIQAMREPNKEMVDAAYAAADAYENAPVPKAWCGLASAYHAMIDAALKETPHD